MSKWEAAAEQLNIRCKDLTISFTSSLSHLIPSLDHFVRPPLNISTIKVDLDRANPKIGVGVFEFSKDSRWIASRNGKK